MKIKPVKYIPFGNSELSEKIFAEVSGALENICTTQDGQFVVNDTEWFWLNPQKKMMPSVVNSAKFLSGRFQGFLKSRGWSIDHDIAKQEIDAYLEVEGAFTRFKPQLPFLDFLQRVSTCIPDWELEATSLFRKYYQTENFTLEDLPSTLHNCFEPQTLKDKIRVGVEFETGNIASSSRALLKLDSLYQKGTLDLGIFVTSFNKSDCAARIWPSSNRNGSIQELLNRDVIANREIPLWVIGFEPDGFDKEAGYLSANQELYDLTDTGEVMDHNSQRYAKFVNPANGEEKYRLI